MKTRRSFIKTTAQLGMGALLLQYLSACKSDDKKAVAAAEEEIQKQLSIAPDAPYQMQYLRGDIGIFTERGGTIGWMANQDGIVVIDTQFPEQSEHLVTELQNISEHAIDLVINTHHHGDHSSGNPVFKDIAGKILAHENSKKNQLRVAEARSQEGAVFPTETFTTSHVEKVGGESIRLYYHGPAHTDGDAITHFENTNVVHMGDLIFNRRFPYIDKSAGASIRNWVTVLDRALDTFDTETQFIFGHSGNDYPVTGGKEDIRAFQNYLEKLLEFGEKSIAAGKTVEELKAEVKGIPGAPEWKGDGVGRSLEAVYEELEG